MDDKERMAEMEALLRETLSGFYMVEKYERWKQRRDVILVLSPDQDAGARNVLSVWAGALPQHTGDFSEYDLEWKNAFRAVAVWHKTEMKAARIAALRKALEGFKDEGLYGGCQTIHDMIAEAEAPDNG